MDDFPKVVDFGLVKDLEHRGSVGLTRADVVAGTPLFLAPETVTAPSTVSDRSDLYSLGAVGYFALTGTHVFEGSTLVEVCSHHLHTPPEPPWTRIWSRSSSTAWPRTRPSDPQGPMPCAAASSAAPPSASGRRTTPTPGGGPTARGWPPPSSP
jgi:serine/threonine protein kinase